MPVKPLKGKWLTRHPYPLGIALGEAILWASLLALSVFWIVYWRVVFHYMEDKALQKSKENIQAELTARIFGHISSLLSGLVLLPASRTGLWVEVFAVPYERTIKYHRMLGALAYVVVTLHAVVWWCKWWKEGNLGVNIVSYRHMYISNYGYAMSDYSMTLAQLAWALMTVSLLMAALLRRRSYAVFQYSHKFVGIVFYVSAIVHGWSFW